MVHRKKKKVFPRGTKKEDGRETNFFRGILRRKELFRSSNLREKIVKRKTGDAGMMARFAGKMKVRKQAQGSWAEKLESSAYRKGREEGANG